MKLFDEYGRPTHEHEELALRGLEMAKEILGKGYVTDVHLKWISSGKVQIEVSLHGKLTKRGRTGKILPFGFDPETEVPEERFVISSAFDEIELELSRKLTGWAHDRPVKVSRQAFFQTTLKKGLCDRFEAEIG